MTDIDDLPVDSTDPTLPEALLPGDRWVREIEALLLASEQPLTLDQLQRLLADPELPDKRSLREALQQLSDQLATRAVEVVEVASGWRLQVRQAYAPAVARLWQEKPPRLSRALLETLAIICYQQPVTRGEIEEIRGVALSPGIMRTLLERGWIREVGVKEVPGRPTLFGTSTQLLDDLGLRSLDALPALPAIKDPEQLEAALLKLGASLPPSLPVASTEPVEAAAGEQDNDDGAPEASLPLPTEPPEPAADEPGVGP